MILERNYFYLKEYVMGFEAVVNLLSKGEAAHVPPQLRHAHSVRRHFAEGAIEPDEPPGYEVDRGVHEGICAGRDGPAPDAVLQFQMPGPDVVTLLR